MRTERIVVESQGAFIRLRRPAYWLFVGCLVAGLLILGRAFSPEYDGLATALWAAIAVNAVVAVVFLVILARLDLFEREPPTVRAAAMCWGGIAAVAFSKVSNDAALVVLAELADAKWSRTWGPPIAGPLNEEWLKAVGVAMLVLIVREHFDGAIDGLIYGALVGLGFQIVENLLYAINFAALNPNSDMAGALTVTFTRVLVAGPFSHPLYTGAAGLGIAFLVTQTRRPMATRAGVCAGLFVLALAMHGLWNLPLPASFPPGLAIPLTYGKGLIILGLFLVLYHLAARAEWRWFVTTMSDQDESIITTQDLTEMRSLRSRRRARKRAGKRYGKRAAQLTGRLHRELVNLAPLAARDQRRGGSEPDGPDVAAVKRNIAVIRAELAEVKRGAPAKVRLPPPAACLAAPGRGRGAPVPARGRRPRRRGRTPCGAAIPSRRFLVGDS